MRRYLAGVLAALFAVAALGVASAGGERYRAGDLVMDIGGGVHPKRLPKKRLAPIALKLFGHLRRVDGGHPPVTRRIVLDFDRNGTVYTRGLPVCRPAKLQARNTKQALRACRRALVGHGTSTAEVAFPEQAPFTAKGPLLIFNGPRHRHRPSLVMHVYARVPTPTAFVIRARITHAKGRRYGKRVKIWVPKIAGGAGALTDFKAKIYRRWRFHGSRRSYLLARCRTGHFLARGRLWFGDGSSISGRIVRRCQRR